MIRRGFAVLRSDSAVPIVVVVGRLWPTTSTFRIADQSRPTGVTDDGIVLIGEELAMLLRTDTEWIPLRPDVQDAAASHDGQRLATLTSDGVLNVDPLRNNPSSGWSVSLPYKPQWIAWSPDNREIAIADSTGDLSILDATRGLAVQPPIRPAQPLTEYLEGVHWPTSSTVLLQVEYVGHVVIDLARQPAWKDRLREIAAQPTRLSGLARSDRAFLTNTPASKPAPYPAVAFAIECDPITCSGREEPWDRWW